MPSGQTSRAAVLAEQVLAGHWQEGGQQCWHHESVAEVQERIVGVLQVPMAVQGLGQSYEFHLHHVNEAFSDLRKGC